MKNFGFWLAAVIGVILDQLSKRWAVEHLLRRESGEIQLWPGIFHLTYTENTGAAFSLFADSGYFLRYVSLIVSLALMAFAIWGPRMTRWEQAGYGLILAGAIGNGIDRFMQGYVVDLFNFILIEFPVFNIADVAINIGVGCLIVGTFLQRSQEPEAPQASDTSDSQMTESGE